MAGRQEDFQPGQRWISDTEPELGLGLISRVTDRTVTVLFEASNAQREYARRSAPLRRVRFRVGDTVRDKEENSLTIKSVHEQDGLIVYGTNESRKKLSETDLSAAIVFDKPEDRLYAGQFDDAAAFDLRLAALEHQHRQRQSSTRGFVGGRIDLIPHQIYIASEVAARLAPRVLLADEVGLGKTIEACLILHRLILTGRVQRALILVPDSLVHQWFVELLRRFNLWFHIFDEERCAAIEAVDPEANPFLDDQLILCSVHLCSNDEKRKQQAVHAGWDIVVVDEAHHLRWTPDSVSPEYALIEELARSVPGLLLLTATPEQLGMESHFARLRLLDPDRFYDFASFLEESRHYREIAAKAQTVSDPMELETLLDRHGTGRIHFRNTRSTISAFSDRRVHLHPLPPDKSKKDPRVDWLARLLRTLEPEKVLLICRNPSLVSSIEHGLRLRLKSPKIAVFHEELSLIQRDRNAAWFAEADGAFVLLCSEIGSEGRNFQFAHHMVLFDLPIDPELLEQRIGRLDRIGQTHEIQVHVPFVVGSFQEVLARWYQEGLNAFESHLPGGHDLLERFGKRIEVISSHEQLTDLITETQTVRAEIAERLHAGRDRLLELHSFRLAEAGKLVTEIRLQDNDRTLDNFILRVLDEYVIPVEELAPQMYRVGSAGVLADSFPGLPADGFTVTSDRERAVVREDIQFLTWDHPLVIGALDLLLGSEKGNSSVAYWPDRETSALYLEAIYVLECVAPANLHIDRFLSPTPIRVVVDQCGNPTTLPSGVVDDPDEGIMLETPEVRDELLPFLLRKTEVIANDRMPAIIKNAQASMSQQMELETERLRELQKVNPSVRSREIDALIEERVSVDRFLSRAHLRLDALRLIRRG